MKEKKNQLFRIASVLLQPQILLFPVWGFPILVYEIIPFEKKMPFWYLILNLRVLTNLFSAKGNNWGTRDSSAHSYRERTTSTAHTGATPSLSSFWGKAADVLQEGTDHSAQKLSLCLGVLTKDGRVVLFQMFYIKWEMRTKARAIFWFIYYKKKTNISKTE